MNRASDIRVDHRHIADMVAPGSRVLDIGCGNGQLLKLLTEEKQVDGRGIELSNEGVNACVAGGLSVIQGNADTDLRDYPDGAFDYAILSQTLQAMHDPKRVLSDLVRIGNRAIVSFPNFGHWRVRLQLLFNGRMPVNEFLPETWYNTPNIHFCTIRDFLALCRELDIRIERSMALDELGASVNSRIESQFANLFGEQGMFLLSRGR
ncbi:methionine biosynthesis protein MetW [Nisaea sp.]|uniref:methionine biosynthesis protein MetW n=1 Tax=Nisaea sp. TaxID=2024842 RepID=UPI003B529ABE